MSFAIVGAGFPAASLIEYRVRFCISALHTKEMLDKTLEVTNTLGKKLLWNTQEDQWIKLKLSINLFFDKWVKVYA